MASPSDPIPRLLAPRVREALADTPVVLIHGPRQSGKTTIPALADSLAGRMGILRLHPLAQCELAGATPRFLDALFSGRFRSRVTERLGIGLAQRIAAGGTRRRFTGVAFRGMTGRTISPSL